MKLTIGLLCIFVLLVTIGAPPVVENVNKGKEHKPDTKSDEDPDDVVNNLEYGRYLKEVVDILESDPEFKKKLENASLEDIKSGNIAEHLSLVQHNVRTRLDEAKQREMDRLRDFMGQKMRHLNERQRLALNRNDPNGRHMKQFLPQHVDARNSKTFGQHDLERLIQHASKDLDELDRKRESEFKEYEMRKEYHRRAKLAKLNTDERKRLEDLHREALEKKKQHKKLNHPGSVDQMEEVWEKDDKLEPDQFSPKVFFKLHDIDGNGFLDEDEVHAVMLKEAGKVHDDAPEADPVEKLEEINRMREHVMKEFDKNNDRMLSFDEFELGINGTEAKNDKGWQSIEDTTIFSDQEFHDFSERLAPVSTSIPASQTPSPSGDQQPQGAPAAAAQPEPAPQQPQASPAAVAQPEAAPAQMQPPQQQENHNPPPPPAPAPPSRNKP